MLGGTYLNEKRPAVYLSVPNATTTQDSFILLTLTEHLEMPKAQQ